MSKLNGVDIKYHIHNGVQLKKWIHNGVEIFTGSSTVIYYVDADKVYQEEVDSGESCLSPTSFTPEVEGYTFLGWTEHETLPTADVLTEKTMEGDPITLYAVYTKDVTLTAYDEAEPTVYTGTVYYHASTATRYGRASFSITPTDKDGWTTVGWSLSANGFTNDAWNGISITDDLTIYAVYKRDVSLQYNGNGGTTLTIAWDFPKTAYYNSSGTYSPAEFTLKENYFTKNGYSFVAWAMGSTDGFQYNAGDTVPLTESTTFYAVWKADEVTVYSATYSGDYMENAEVSVNDVTYMDSTADYHYQKRHQGTVGETSTKEGTLLAFTEAAKGYKYAKIVLAYCGSVNYGDIEIGYKLNTDTDLTYLWQGGTGTYGIKTVEITVETADVNSIMYYVYLLNKSSATYWLISGAIGVQSVTLSMEF